MTKFYRTDRIGLAIVAATFLFAYIGTSQTAEYDQPYRPQVHFSPRRNWTNDPNGLVFFHGEYHLFYQYNPFGDQWGHMGWGHAVSADMLHWKELPVAIPEKDGVMTFTGSVVIDEHNTSGFCDAKPVCMVAIYTGASNTPNGPRQSQNIAYSRDDGRTWTRYSGNPVLDLKLADFRDPSVSWDEKEHRWLMAVSLAAEHKVRFYASPNLRQWTMLSDFGPMGDIDGVWECPDLLHVPDADGHGPGIWALKIGLNPGALQGGSGEQYFLGSFDGKNFTVSNTRGSHGWTDYGKDDYCAISFNHLPEGQHPVLLGWMDNWQYANRLPTSPWRGQMTLPRRVSLVRDETGLSLRQEPIVELLRSTNRPAVISSSSALEKSAQQVPFELDIQFTNLGKEIFGVRVYSDEQHWTEIAYDTIKNEFYIDRTKSGLTVSPDFLVRTAAPLAVGRPLDLRVVVDRSSVEAFAQNGTIAMTNLIYPVTTGSRMKIETFSNGKNVGMKGQIWNLQSVWSSGKFPNEGR